VPALWVRLGAEFIARMVQRGRQRRSGGRPEADKFLITGIT
jgi:hypothetical protein